MEIKQLKIDELIPYANNPRDNQGAVEYVANSIKEFGFKNPIIIDKDNVIIAGHTRLEAAKKLEMKEVPCIIAEDLTEEQARAFRLADNKVAEISEWNLAKLELETLNLDKKYLEHFGFEFEYELNVEDEEQVKDLKEQSRIKEMEIKAFEHHDYLVFVFDNQSDWLNAVTKFDIGKVDAGYGETKKVGIGRVLSGKKLLEKI